MSTPSLVKQPAESRIFSMDFAGLMVVGETITSVTSVTASPDGLTLVDASAHAGQVASQRISAGVSGTRYKVTFVVVTSLGNTLEGEGILQVKDL